VLVLAMEASGRVEVQLNSAAQKTLVKIIFVTLKIICVSNVFFHVEFKCVIRSTLSPTVFMWKSFLNAILANLVFVCHAPSTL